MKRRHSNSTPVDAELQQLVDLLCNQQLSEEGMNRLQNRLRNEPASREYYRNYLVMHAQLQRVVPNLLPVAADASMQPVPALQVSRDSNRFNAKAMAQGGGLVALVLLVGLLTVVQSRQHGTGQGVDAVAAEGQVKLKQNARARFSDREAHPVLGASLDYQKEYTLTAGSIELQFPSGATSILRGPTIFQLLSDTQLKINHGLCSVHDPHEKSGLEILTPAALVTNAGIRSAINVDHYGLSEIQVIEGSANVISDSGRRQTLEPLSAGSAMRYELAGADTGVPIPFNPSKYADQLPDRIISYHGPLNELGEIEELSSVTVQRHGQRWTYQYDELIGGDVVSAVWAGRSSALVPDWHETSIDAAFPHDRYLSTGIINIGCSDLPTLTTPVLRDDRSDSSTWTPGICIRFRKPVINGTGPDIVFFEVQTGVDSPAGDAFHVVPMSYRKGLKPLTIAQYDIDFHSEQARRLIEVKHLTERIKQNDQQLETYLTKVPLPLRYRVLATGIDLSDLGYSIGESVSEIFIQGIDHGGHIVDPVLIAGLPETNGIPLLARQPEFKTASAKFAQEAGSSRWSIRSKLEAASGLFDQGGRGGRIRFTLIDSPLFRYSFHP